MRSATAVGLLLTMVGAGCGGNHLPRGQPDDRPATTSQHNFEVLRTDLPAGDLPVSDLNFAVEVEAPGIESSGSVLPLPDGARESLPVTLESGTYVLICNLTSHYQRGMWAKLSVR